LLVVLDATAGTEVFRVERPSRVTAVAFANDGRTVLAGAEDGTIVTVDATTGKVVGEVTMTDPAVIIALGLRPDDVTVAVSRRSIELFDPADDRRGVPIGIPTADEARVRPDGTVVVVPSADTDSLKIIDPNRGPLVEQGWDVDPAALVGFGAGRAAAVDPSGSAEVIELATGVRTALTLSAPDGEAFDAVAMTPESDGYLAWNDGTAVARWRGGELVEQLELWTGLENVSQTRSGVRTGFPGFGDDAGAGAAGGGFAGAGAMAVYEYEVVKELYAFDPSPGNLALVSVNESPPATMTAVAHAPDDGLYVVMGDGVVRRYDETATRRQEIDTGLANATLAITDPTTGSVALGGENGVVVVSPATESVQSVNNVGAVVSLGFARDGTLLVAVERDGTVRLWDTVRAESVGTLWNGSGTAPSSPPWYDVATDSVWVATSGKILQFSLEPARWVERVCELVSRELTVDEWDRLVPGEIEQRPACS
jgi:WD40 repeat protein